MSGVGVANVLVTGSFTIPAMKKMGYRPTLAAAVEAAASTGGILMPPVMGAAAFLMADILAVSYWEIVVAAFLPGLMGVLYWRRSTAHGVIAGMIVGVVSTAVWRFFVIPAVPAAADVLEVFVGVAFGTAAFVIGSVLTSPKRLPPNTPTA